MPTPNFCPSCGRIWEATERYGNMCSSCGEVLSPVEDQVPEKVSAVVIEGLVKAPKRTIIVDVTSTIREKTFTSPINVSRILKRYDGQRVRITIEDLEVSE